MNEAKGPLAVLVLIILFGFTVWFVTDLIDQDKSVQEKRFQQGYHIYIIKPEHEEAQQVYPKWSVKWNHEWYEVKKSEYEKINIGDKVFINRKGEEIK